MFEFVKRGFSLLLVAAMLICSMSFVTFAEEETVPPLPTATVTKLEKEDLTFALKFTADKVTDEQLAYYGPAYADFVLTFNKDVTLTTDETNENGNGWLSGQYDAWSENWINVPFNGVAELKANEPLRIMEYAAKSFNQTGLKVTFNDVYNSVKKFSCGVYLNEEFLAANPDIEVSLELRIFDPRDESISATVGNEYVFTLGTPELPTATVTEIKNQNLTFAMNFVADAVSAKQLTYYSDWYADFELTFSEDVVMDAVGAPKGTADGYLAGQYDKWSPNWVVVPYRGPVTLKANEPLKIMEYAAEYMGEPGLKYTYGEVYNIVKDFDCGVFLTEEYLQAHPDVVITLELKMYNPKNEAENYVIGDTYTFSMKYVAKNTRTDKKYTSVNDAFATGEYQTGDTVILLKDTDGYRDVLVPAGLKLDLNGYALSTEYFTCYGNTVDTSAENTGAVAVAQNQYTYIQPDNEQVPMLTDKGYQFVELIYVRETVANNGTRFVFQMHFEPIAHKMLKEGGTCVSVAAVVNWTASSGTGSQVFVFNDSLVQSYLSSYNAATGKYAKVFVLDLANADQFTDLTYDCRAESTTGVKHYGYEYTA